MTAPLGELRLFGVPTLIDGPGIATVFTPERRYQLLAYLACHGGWVTRDELATLFWPDRSQSVARSNLRKVLLSVARMAPRVEGVEQQGDRLRWQVASDLTRVRLACDAGRHADALALAARPLLEAMDAGLSEVGLDWIADARRETEDRWLGAAHALLSATEGAIELESLARRILARFDDDPMALAALDRTGRGAAAGPASPATTTLIGRTLELETIQHRLVTDGVRVLTVMGLGGAGKSTIARAAQLRLAGHYAGRAWWVGLENVRRAGELPGQMLEAMAVRPTPTDGGAWQTLARNLSGAPALMVLDNAEHLQLAEPLTALLESCPNLQLLVASRTRVGLPDEQALALGGLPLPDHDEREVAALLRFDAIRLFVARASAAAPAFDLQREAADVVRLVHALDGLPLGIELAAPWVRLVPVGDIVAGIASSIDTLGRGQTDARHASIRACFDYSRHLLSRAEAQALERLAQLPAPFDREIAQQAADCSLVAVAALVDKSLVRAEGQGWFSLHPLLRQWAGEHPGSQDDGAAMRRFVRLAEDALLPRWVASHHAVDAPTRAVEAFLAANILAAWRAAIEHGLHRFVEAAAGVIGQHFEDHAPLEGVEWLRDAVKAFAAHAPQAKAAAAAGLAAGRLLALSNHAHAASAQGRAALRLAQRSGDPAIVCDCLNLLGALALTMDDAALAEQHLGQAALMARELGDPQRLVRASGNLSVVESGRGRYAVALDLARESLAAARALGVPLQVVHDLCQIGNVHLFLGQGREAIAPLEEALRLCERHRIQALKPTALCNLGRAFVELRDLVRARRYLERAIDEARTAQRERAELLAMAAMTALEALEGHPEAARRSLATALELGRRRESQETAYICIVASGDVEWAVGRRASALAIWRWVVASDAFDVPDRDLVRVKLDGMLRDTTVPSAADVGDVAETNSLGEMLELAESLSRNEPG